MYSHVWPKVDEKGNCLSYKENLKQKTQKEFEEINEELNKPNLSAQGGIDPSIDSDPNDTDSKKIYRENP